MKTVRYFILVVLLLIPSALAQAEFDVYGFDMTEFRNIETVDEACGAPAASSFFCGRQGESLTRIPTKGADFFFNPAGELVAVYSKQQKGQRLRNYPIDGGQNLIPFQAPAPGAAILIGGEYFVPEEVEGSWSRLTNTEFEGSFRYLVGSYQVDKRVVVSNVRLSLEIGVEVSLAAQAAVETGARDPIFIQLAFPGIGRTDEPVIKIGQGENFSLNPLSQPVVNPSYASVQNNNRNTATAIVMRPTGATGGLSAQSYPGDLIAFQKELTTGSTVSLSAEVYTGPNELIRYDQEGYLELAGLFRPNILGRLSLAILWVLHTIHDGIGNWGLSIIVLTLVFRAVIWPLISTQTRSMYGMQELQPKIKTLQKKYKDDRQKLTEETMKLYKEAGRQPGRWLPADPGADAAVHYPLEGLRQLRIQRGIPVDSRPRAGRPPVHPADPLRRGDARSVLLHRAWKPVEPAPADHHQSGVRIHHPELPGGRHLILCSVDAGADLPILADQSQQTGTSTGQVERAP